MNLAATISIYAYGTSEGVKKAWETRRPITFSDWYVNENTGDTRQDVKNDYGETVGRIMHDDWKRKNKENEESEKRLGIHQPDFDDTTIRDIWVHPEYRKHGVGEQLYRNTIQYAKEHGYKYVLSDTSVSKDAQDVWEKLSKSGDYKIDKYAEGGKPRYRVTL